MENLRDKIVWLSKELAESEDEPTRRRLRKQIAALKDGLTPTEPTRIGDFFKKKM